MTKNFQEKGERQIMAKYQKGTGLQNADSILKSIFEFFKSQQGEILSLFEKQPMSAKEDGGFVGGMDLYLQGGLLDLFRCLIDYIVASEELPSTWPPQGDSFWLIDPCDGTHNAGRGSFNFGSMGALIEKFSVVLSWIYLPMEEQALGSGFYVAAKGHGAFQHIPNIPTGLKPLRVSTQDVLEKATVNLEGVSKKLPDYKFATALRKTARNSNGQSCAWDFALMAKGIYKPLPLDAMVSFNNKPWDNIPGTLIVEEAEGKVTDFYGMPWSLENCSSLIFSNGLLHDQILALNCPAFR